MICAHGVPADAGRPACVHRSEPEVKVSARRPKLAHVAMAAGVSIGTASDALRGKGRMSDATRERVAAAAEDLDYRPHAHAQILALGHSHIVALVIRQPDGPERLYWPRLQSAFTERLLRGGVVACTMSLDDLHKLDGLPFDLIVYAGISSSEGLPAEIRAGYRVLDIDLVGSTTFRQDLEDVCTGVLDQFVSAGATHPGLILGQSTVVPGAHLVEAYRSWCDQRGLEPLVLHESPDDADRTSVRRALGIGMDALFAVQTDLAIIAEQIATDDELAAFPVIALTAERPAPSSLAVSHMSIDGEVIGAQLAGMAIAVLNDEPVPPLRLAWELDEQPWQPRPPD